MNLFEPKRGDIVELRGGKKYVFIEMKRTKSVVKDMKSDAHYSVRNDDIIKNTGKVDESQVIKYDKWESLQKWDLFSISDRDVVRKETFMFVEWKNKKPIGINVANGKKTKIDTSFKIKKISIEHLKTTI